MLTRPRIPWTWIAIAVLALIALVALGLCSRSGQTAREAKDDRTMSEARTVSATEAISEISALGERAGATQSEVKEAQDAVRQAAPEDRDRVFRYRLCVVQHRPDCARLLGTGPADPDAGHAPR